MRYALKFAYDGSAFEGYVRQPGMSTVEGEIIRAMERLRVIKSAANNNFQSASRTDRGVSAAGNVIVIDTNFEKKALVPALNSELDGVYFWALAEIEDGFNARHAEQRWYRYVLPLDQCPDLALLREGARSFLGEHDFREFSKKDTGVENTILTLDSIEIIEYENFVFVDFRARRFLWQMVRRMVTAMLVGEKKGAGIGPAPAENLILMDVIYDFNFEAAVEKAGDFSVRKSDAEIRAKVMGQIVDFTSV